MLLLLPLFQLAGGGFVDDTQSRDFRILFTFRFYFPLSFSLSYFYLFFFLRIPETLCRLATHNIHPHTDTRIQRAAQCRERERKKEIIRKEEERRWSLNTKK